MVECLCVGGVGIFVFFIVIGYGIVVVEGKEICEFDGKYYVMEIVLCVDVVLVKVWKVDEVGNLVFCKIVCNFNLVCVMVGRLCIVEVEEVVLVGSIDLD